MSEDKNLKMTGERVVPHDLRTVEEYLQYLRHLFVYEHIRKQLTSDDKVLEIGFGEGYGTNILASACKKIIAVDIEKSAVDYANEKYGKNNCSFMWYKGNDLPFDDEKFDAIVTLQVIEHIDDDSRFANEMYRTLNENGRCFITTPNRETRLKPGQKPWNRFHKREYSGPQLSGLLSRSFEKVDVFGIKASKDIMKLELDRIHPGFLIGFGLKLGLRKIIPTSVDPYVARLVGILKGHKKLTNFKEFPKKYTIADYWIEKKDVSSCLDLYAYCVKTLKTPDNA